MNPKPPSATLFECGVCGNLGFGQGEMTCCERTMQPVGEGDGGVTEPSLDQLLQTVFDMSETELDVCLCVMESGEQTATQLAEQVGYDRSVISRHLNHLADLGVVDKQRRLLTDGGHVYVYTPTEPDAIRRRLAGAFLSWSRAATALIDSVSKEKVEAIVDKETDNPQWRIYRD